MAKEKKIGDEMDAFFSGGHLDDEEDSVEQESPPTVKEEEKKQLEKILSPPQQPNKPNIAIQEVKTPKENSFTPDIPKDFNLDGYIEDEAEKRKQEFKKKIYSNFVTSLMNFDKETQPQSLPSPQKETVIVKDSSDTIKVIDQNIMVIDNQILDPNIKDLAPLLLIKRNLQKQKAELEGKIFVEEPIVSPQQPKQNQKKQREFSLVKVGIPLFVSVILISLAVFFGLTALGIIHL